MHAESGSRLTVHPMSSLLARLGAFFAPRRQVRGADFGTAVRRAFPEARPFSGPDGSVDRAHFVLHLD